MSYESEYCETVSRHAANGYGVPSHVVMEILRRADAELAEARAIIAKLPKTADGVVAETLRHTWGFRCGYCVRDCGTGSCDKCGRDAEIVKRTVPHQNYSREYSTKEAVESTKGVRVL
jgi:hypothetical protein